MTTTQQTGSVGSDTPQPASLERSRAVVADVAASMGQVISGKPEVIRLSLVALLAEGHLLYGRGADAQARADASLADARAALLAWFRAERPARRIR